ncbi:MAG: heavy metal translocating P-type ATPase [Actinomycetes bacterium]
MTDTIELDIGGMTCASCASRIERKLNKLDGVTATVNYATEKARVNFPQTLTPSDLVDVVVATGYTAKVPVPDAAVADESGVLRRRLIVSAALAVPVLLVSMISALQFSGWMWFALTLATPVVGWGALPFHRAAWRGAQHASASMDTLVSIGIIAAYSWSWYSLLSGGMNVYLEVASTVTVFLLGGRYAEARAKRRSGAALRALLELGAKDVAVLRDGVEVIVPIGDLRVGETFVVRPGEKIATDGEIESGTSAIDTSLITGESVPVDVGPGDGVTGGMINATGALRVRATRVGTDTQLARFGRMVTEAQSGKAEVQRLADRIAGVFVPVVLVLTVLTFLGWLLSGAAIVHAVTAAVSVLVIACPCALGLATPTALLVGTGRGAQLGILIRGPQVLESTRRVDTVVLDKTGTVTSGHLTLHGVRPASDVSSEELLRLVGALEAASEHPVGRAIAAAAAAIGDLPAVTDFHAYAGAGVGGMVDGRSLIAGRPEWLAADWSLSLPAELADAFTAETEQGRTTIAAAWDGAIRGLLVVSDTVRPSSKRALVELRKLGLRPILLTGDHPQVARAIAAEVGIAADDVRADVRPEGKAAAIAELQREGATVAMVGDGVNDAIALATANLGLAMGSGTDVAIEASDITLVRSDLTAVVDAIRLSRATLRTIKGNLFWAFAYNIAAIPLAAAGLLNPMIAGGAMAFSSIFVVTNSLRLRRFRPLDLNR